MEILPDGHRGLEFTRIEELEGLVGFDRDILIDFYLENIQPSYPLLTNRDVTYLSSSRSKLDPSLLAAVYSLAASSKSHSNQYLLPKLDELTSGLLQESFIRPRLCSVQAALIAAQCWSMNSSILTMQINAAAFDLGLHQDCSQWNISESHKSLRRRLAWALYAHDKWTAFSTGRPSLISPNNWAVRRLSPTDFEPPQSNVPTVELFSQYITLSTLLSSVLDTFYTLASSSMVSPQQILGLAKPVQLQLKEWYSNLPACLKMDSSIINSGTDSPRPENHSSKPLAFLHLAYFTTEILLHRCIIRSLSPASVSSTPPSAYTPLHHICRLAAKTRLISSLDFCNRLRPEHISAFWPVGSRTQFALIGSFGTLLLATSPTNEEEDFYSARLHEFRWTLGVCSSAAGEDRLGFSDALDKLDLGVELWQKGRELKGSRNRSVKDVAEEMKRTQPPGAMSLQQLPGSSLPTTRIRPEFADGVMDVDFENGFNTDDESLEGSDD
ncbi:putative c6 transcription factor [Phaeomoniella chlamydospora]|uniref:Putative c6 transcription factor n=1 Tax=Phaeomoniella chlamydospora TaxID=158046 RepID=A0A0G2EUU1_PHACM|nr:putative c6 transcription factor [Phaeomoniella chlamydospora]